MVVPRWRPRVAKRRLEACTRPERVRALPAAALPLPPGADALPPLALLPEEEPDAPAPPGRPGGCGSPGAGGTGGSGGGGGIGGGGGRAGSVGVVSVGSVGSVGVDRLGSRSPRASSPRTTAAAKPAAALAASRATSRGRGATVPPLRWKTCEAAFGIRGGVTPAACDGTTGSRETAAAALLQATSISAANAAGVVGAALLSVLLCPLGALLLRQPDRSEEAAPALAK